MSSRSRVQILTFLFLNPAPALPFAQIYKLVNRVTIQLPIVFNQYYEENQKLDIKLSHIYLYPSFTWVLAFASLFNVCIRPTRHLFHTFHKQEKANVLS